MALFYSVFKPLHHFGFEKKYLIFGGFKIYINAIKKTKLSNFLLEHL